jgi:hypothetical protein
MGVIAGCLGGVEREAGPETRIILEALENAIADLQNAIAATMQQVLREPQGTQETRAAAKSVTEPAARWGGKFGPSFKWVIPSSVHGLDTANMVTVCYDPTGKVVIPDSTTIDATSKTVTIIWAAVPQAGTCVIV